MTVDTGVLVDGVLNFRDLGGMPATDGVTRTGVLYRSANLGRLTDAGRDALRALGVRQVVDLRADDEVAHEPSRIEGLDVDIVRVPLFLGSVASFFERDATLGELYRSLLDESGDRLVEAVRAVVAAQPALVHCAVGKDRTGVVVALVLGAVGVEPAAIVADYAATEANLPPERNARLLAYLQQVHPEAQNLEELATRSPAEAMQGLLAEIDARYGSTASYLRAHGLTDDELDALRGILVEPEVVPRGT